jgi:hypothetical protein
LPRRLLPNPAQLFRLYERDELTREQLHAAMDWHARQILEDVARARLEPAGSLLERALSRRAAAKLAAAHGEAELREVFVALSELPDFPPANLLWNAGHRDVPLYCFLRIRTEPVFRVLRFERERMVTSIVVEYGVNKKKLATREEFRFRRNRFAQLVVEVRSQV